MRQPAAKRQAVFLCRTQVPQRGVTAWRDRHFIVKENPLRPDGDMMPKTRAGERRRLAKALTRRTELISELIEVEKVINRAQFKIDINAKF